MVIYIGGYFIELEFQHNPTPTGNYPKVPLFRFPMQLANIVDSNVEGMY